MRKITIREAKKLDKELDRLLIERGHSDLRVTVMPALHPEHRRVVVLLYLKDLLYQLIRARTDWEALALVLTAAATSGKSDRRFPTDPPLRLEIVVAKKRLLTEQYLVIPHPVLRP